MAGTGTNKHIAGFYQISIVTDNLCRVGRINNRDADAGAKADTTGSNCACHEFGFHRLMAFNGQFATGINIGAANGG